MPGAAGGVRWYELRNLSTTPAIFAARFGAPVFDLLVTWSTVKEPMLREAIVRFRKHST